MSAAKLIHVFRNQGNDESEVWCGESDYFQWSHYDEHGRSVWTDPADPSKATCAACLRAIVAFGEQAASRLRELESTPATPAEDVPNG